MKSIIVSILVGVFIVALGSQAICEDKSVQGSAMSSVKNADFVEMTLKYATSPLHPGAIRYFKERGLSVPERLIEN